MALYLPASIITVLEFFRYGPYRMIQVRWGWSDEVIEDTSYYTISFIRITVIYLISFGIVLEHHLRITVVRKQNRSGYVAPGMIILDPFTLYSEPGGIAYILNFVSPN